MPPSDWNCSCSVRPTDKEPTAVPEGEYVSPVFQNNPGKSAEFVKLKEHPYIKKICPNFKGCGTNTDIQLSDSGDKEICMRICEIAKDYYTNVAKKQKDLRKWYKENLPEVKVGKFVAKRFEVNHTDVPNPIIINKNFYNEVSGKYVNDKLYSERLELAKKAHEIIIKAHWVDNEKPKHYNEDVNFLYLSYEERGLEIIFKCKVNADGVFLHYMWHKRK